MTTKRHDGAEPIAIVGMALRVPGAVSLDQFWRNILTATDSLSRPSNDELRRSGVSRQQLSSPKFIPAGPILTDIEYFDAAFFGMTAYEAERTDPSSRLFLECVWEALEAAGLPPGRDGPVTGVFAGGEGEYRKDHLSILDEPMINDAVEVRDRGKDLQLHLGNSVDFLTTRVAHKLDLTGSTFSVLAACATSLVAVHLGVQSLRRRECRVAVAGGSGVLMPHVGAYMSSVEGMLSASGRVRPFDAGANGTIFGSGAGAVVLRPLEDALADGNPIWAVVRGSGVSNDGDPPGKESFIAPSREGQIASVEAALSDAGVPARSIGYLEAHGTATLLGDPTEVASVSEVYRRETEARGYCGLGSVKGNVGHLRTAAGVISVIKTCLALNHRMIPPVANFVEHNPRIDFASSPFFVTQKPLPWNESHHPRRAAVSAFGFGGTNAHAILEEYVRGPAPASSRRHHLLTVSAKTETALRRSLADLAAYLHDHPDGAVADVAHTLQCGRDAMPHRASAYANEDAKRDGHLRLVPAASGIAKSTNRPVVFLFPGQGSQRPGMGREIYERETLYREIVDRCAELLEPQLGLDIRDLIHPSQSGSGAEILRSTANAQPALFVVGYALARLFMSWGVRPEELLGHSIGEIVAACVAGVFSLEDALTLVAARARLMQACEPGAMAAVFLSESRLQESLAGHDLEIAALNAPSISVVAGREPDILRFIEEMTQAGVGTRRIETSHAFHSHMMEPALDAFRDVVREIELKAPTIPVISNETGLPLTPEQAGNPDYWARHIRQTVRFTTGSEQLVKERDRVFLELGPGHSLCDLIKQHDPSADAFGALEEGSAETPEDEKHSALVALGRLWCAGGAVEWRRHYAEPRQKLVLPTYPFERQRHWVEPRRLESRPREGLFLYEPGWRQADLDHDRPMEDDRAWLIFKDDLGVAELIAEKLRQRKRAAVLVTPGDSFAEIAPDTFTVRPDSKEDLGAALAAARARDSGLAPQVLHLWSLTGRSGEHNTVDAFRLANRSGFYTLIALTQAAFDAGASDLDVMVVADGLRQMEGEDTPLFAEKGALLGPIRNVGKEFPGVSLRLIDLFGFEEQPLRDSLCEAIIIEAGQRQESRTVCLRPGGRYVEELYPLPYPPLARTRLRDGGTVLITGGLGGLGLKMAGTLFDLAHARLVLTSRQALPPREDWHAIAAGDTRVASVLREIMALEDRGVELLVVAADMGDSDSIKRAVTEARAHFGSINGVVHAAGFEPGGPAIHTTAEMAEPAFEAKVHGAMTLEEVFAETPLDFFINLSSVASYRPIAGQTVYTAANSVLDIMSARRSSAGTGLSCAIAWGAWQEVGMAAAWSEKRVREAKERGLPGRHRHGEAEVKHPLLHSRHQESDGSTIYRGTLRDGDHWICEHRYNDRALLAGVTILELLRASYVDLIGDDSGVEFSKIAFVRPMFVFEVGTEIEIAYRPNDQGHALEVRSKAVGAGDRWTVNAVGLAAFACPRPADPVAIPDIPVWRFRHGGTLHFSMGPRWDCVVGIKVEGDTVWERLSLDEEFRTDADELGLHTATFDRALNDPPKVYGIFGVPYSLDRIRIYGRLGAEYFVRAVRHADSFASVFVDSAGKIVVETDGFVARDVRGSRLEDAQVSTAEMLRSDEMRLGPSQRMVVTQPGSLESLRPRDFDVGPLRRGEVRIKVVAAGLNFRDVLSALGQMPMNGASDPRIGGECSGVVTEVGDGIVDIRPGDPVVALAQNCFAGSVTVHSDLVMPVPSNICLEDAAGIPIVFLTADYALNTLAQLKRGERILIHAAAGGVGLAAVQIAQRVGAEIFATAGHPDKHQYLKSIGVNHVMDSRSLSFADEVRELTRGEGVDVVLNSLAGDYIRAGLDLLRHRGRFLEIGKRDILANTNIGLAPFQNNLTYHAIDLGPMIERRDDLLVDLFDSLMLRFGKDELIPIPTAVMPIADVSGAMQRMARAEHIGKIVLKVGDDPDQWRSVFKKFLESYGRGIELRDGLDSFRRILSANAVPPTVLALGQPIGEVGQVEYRVGGRRNTRPTLSSEYRAPTNDVEERLVHIWESALGVSPIGIDDDFFDLGGDSITAIQTQFSIADEFGVDLSASAFFDFPTIAGLAGRLLANSDTPTSVTENVRTDVLQHGLS